ncbi:unnamed protein product [Leptidea sinapis]|uniref:Ubiquitin carboxyl-terminal hydrolase MINDY n=1 Tax=Leptidea sinapis TaxID=189913 RepID=A0A5E4PU62_9NEOP|nr:unnamed protein product [Leptidea sinapis]
MDHLTNFLVYNKTPISRDDVKFDSRKKKKENGELDKRYLLLSPNLKNMSDATCVLQKSGKRKLSGDLAVISSGDVAGKVKQSRKQSWPCQLIKYMFSMGPIIIKTALQKSIRKDLDGKLSYLVSTQVEGSLNVTTLLLTGRATPYLHNGVQYVGDEDHYAMPQFGILSRSSVGLLVWYNGDESSNIGHNVSNQYPGSRLKTPALPIWVTNCSGHYGILFNTNRELLRNYHAERRFDIQYYTCGGCHVILNVDTRAHEDLGHLRNDDINGKMQK